MIQTESSTVTRGDGKTFFEHPKHPIRPEQEQREKLFFATDEPGVRGEIFVYFSMNHSLITPCCSRHSKIAEKNDFVKKSFFILSKYFVKTARSLNTYSGFFSAEEIGAGSLTTPSTLVTSTSTFVSSAAISSSLLGRSASATTVSTSLNTSTPSGTTISET